VPRCGNADTKEQTMRELIKLVGIDEKGKPTGSVYVTDKNKKTTTKKIELKKYCKFTKKHIIHRESKI
jgi:large subunit ribosomal protein L33